ncbi:Transcription factor [Malassezia sp. CBS 17886]|nr:Transcription factor [Malassezia sp. CBS 17886]
MPVCAEPGDALSSAAMEAAANLPQLPESDNRTPAMPVPGAMMGQREGRSGAMRDEDPLRSNRSSGEGPPPVAEIGASAAEAHPAQGDVGATSGLYLLSQGSSSDTGSPHGADGSAKRKRDVTAHGEHDDEEIGALSGASFGDADTNTDGIPTHMRSAYEASADGEDDGGALVDDAEESSKRKSFLERNRQAAYKCRQRKKAWLASLQAKVEYLQSDNESLQHTVESLRSEVLFLKAQLVQQHAVPPTSLDNAGKRTNDEMNASVSQSFQPLNVNVSGGFVPYNASAPGSHTLMAPMPCLTQLPTSQSMFTPYGQQTQPTSYSSAGRAAE